MIGLFRNQESNLSDETNEDTSKNIIQIQLYLLYIPNKKSIHV